MCKFCEPNGLFEGKDISKQIAVESIDVGDVCELFVLDAWLFTDNDGTNPEIDISLSTIFNEKVATLGIPIRYCPVCGKRLVNLNFQIGA